MLEQDVDAPEVSDRRVGGGAGLCLVGHVEGDREEVPRVAEDRLAEAFRERFLARRRPVVRTIYKGGVARAAFAVTWMPTWRRT
jgi:hypothetical protein